MFEQKYKVKEGGKGGRNEGREGSREVEPNAKQLKG